MFAFFFSTVSSRITGLIGSSSNPISGMTIATLILTCLLFVALGWTGDAYAPVALCVGAVVCIAAANAGNTSQDLKTGYIVGATPLYQQIGLIIGVVVSATVIGLTTLYLHRVFTIGSQAIAAPQATLMATIIKGLLSQNLPWGLVLVGMSLSIVLEAVQHPLVVVCRRRVPAGGNDGADLCGRSRPVVGRAQERREGGRRSRGRHAVQLGLDSRRVDLRNPVRGARWHRNHRPVSKSWRNHPVVPRRQRRCAHRQRAALFRTRVSDSARRT